MDCYVCLEAAGQAAADAALRLAQQLSQAARSRGRELLVVPEMSSVSFPPCWGCNCAMIALIRPCLLQLHQTLARSCLHAVA